MTEIVMPWWGVVIFVFTAFAAGWIARGSLNEHIRRSAEFDVEKEYDDHSKPMDEARKAIIDSLKNG